MGYQWLFDELEEGEEISFTSLTHTSKTHPYPHADAVLIKRIKGKNIVLDKVDGIILDDSH